MKRDKTTERMPTKTAVRKFLRQEISSWKGSYTDLIGPDKGKVSNPRAIRAIRHLQAALAFIK